MYAKIINEETKLCEVGYGTNSKFYESIGMTELDVEQAYNGEWYLKGYAPSEPQSDIDKKKVKEAHKYLNDTDWVACKIAEGSATREDYAEIIQKRQEARDTINSLENKNDTEIG